MVDNIIYRLESENFRLEFNPIIHENDLAFPVNTSLNIRYSVMDFPLTL